MDHDKGSHCLGNNNQANESNYMLPIIVHWIISGVWIPQIISFVNKYKVTIISPTEIPLHTGKVYMLQFFISENTSCGLDYV